MRNLHNGSVLRRQVTIPLEALAPRRLLFAGFALWGFVRLSIFYIDFETPASQDAILIAIGYTLAFLAGTVVVSAIAQQRGASAPVNGRAYRRASILLFVVAAAFLALRIYDLVFVRGFLNMSSIAEFRALENTVVGDDRSTSGIGLISGIGYPIAIPVMLFTLAYRQYLPRWLIGCTYLLAVVYAGYVIASGNRYVLVAPVMMALFLLVIIRGGIQMTTRRALALAVVIALAFGYLTSATRQRDEMVGLMTTEQALEVAPDRKLFTPSHGFIELFRAMPNSAQDVTYGYLDIAWYMTHGWYEFVKVVDFADPTDRSWGGAQFATVLYFLRVTGFDVPSEERWRRNLPTYGFYTTFFCPVYLDFGVTWGCLYCMFLGAIAQRVWLGVRRRTLSGTLIYPFVASVIMSAPTNNLLLAGLGVPLLAVTLAVIVIVTTAERLDGPSGVNGARRFAEPDGLMTVGARPAAVGTPYRRRHWA